MEYGVRSSIEMLATVAHELRNPLAAIQAAVRVLQRVSLSSGHFQQACLLIDKQVRRMASVTDDMLNAAHCATGKLVIRKERVDLGSIVIAAVESCRPSIDVGSHEVIVQLPPEPVEIAADPIRMMQALTNVLENSEKYSECHRKIGVTVERISGDAVIRIVDQGIGIPADLLPHVFDLFVQGDNACGRSLGGMGVGLSLVKRIVELHGGAVDISSAGLGKGSTFTMRIPAQLSGQSCNDSLGEA